MERYINKKLSRPFNWTNCTARELIFAGRMTCEHAARCYREEISNSETEEAWREAGYKGSMEDCNALIDFLDQIEDQFLAALRCELVEA
jgi:hypothetical protein